MRKRPAISEDETLNTLLQGRVAVIQRKRGYRFSLDAILLAHFVEIHDGERVVDLGTGNGVVPLILCSLYPSVQAVGIEIQAEMVERALRSVAWNELQHRVQIIPGDVCSVGQLFSPQSFDAAVCNPPYRPLASGRINPDTEKRVARHEIKASVRDFLRAGFYLLRQRGKMAVVYPAKRAVDLLQMMREERVEPKRMRWVHSFAGSEAALVLVEGIKEGRCELGVIPPLVVYDRPGTYTPEVREILKK